MNQYKIAFYTSGLGQTGGNKRILYLADALQRSGHTVHIIVSHSFKERDIRHYSCPVHYHGDAMNVDYDLAIGFNPVHCSLNVFSRLKADRKGLYILHVAAPEQYTPAYQEWIDVFGEHPFLVFGNNPAWRSVYSYGPHVQAIDLVGGIQWIEPRIKRTRDDRTFTIVCNGSSCAWKGFDLVQEAVNRLRLDNIEVVAFAFGAVNAVCLRWPSRIHLNVPYEEMANIYTQGDLYISFEDKQAGWGNTVLEAMMCGVPVICTEWGTKAYARHLKNAYVIERNTTVLRDAIEKLYHDRALRERLIVPEEERKKLYERFSYDRLADDLVKSVFEAEVHA
jgi:glycosyltransferase involved in cell wall biosynthesis